MWGGIEDEYESVGLWCIVDGRAVALFADVFSDEVADLLRTFCTNWRVLENMSIMPLLLLLLWLLPLPVWLEANEADEPVVFELLWEEEDDEEDDFLFLIMNFLIIFYFKN